MNGLIQKISQNFRRSVHFKMTLLTTAVLVLTIVSLWLGQVFFLEKFFVYYKVNQVKSDMIKVVEKCQQEGSDKDKISSVINDFSSRSGLQAAILDSSGNVKYQADYYLNLKTERFGSIHVPLNNVVYTEGFKNLNLQEGSPLVISTLLDESQKEVYAIFDLQNGESTWSNGSIDMIAMTQVATPISITAKAASTGTALNSPSISVALEAAPISQSASAVIRTENIQKTNLYGVIETLKLPTSYNEMTLYDSAYLYSAINRWNFLRASEAEKSTIKPDDTKSNKLFEYAYDNAMTGLSSRILVLSYQDKGEKAYLFVNLGLRPIGDAVEAIKKYYLIGFGIILLPIMLLAFALSKMITKPLVAMNETAGRFEAMDFSAVCEITSEDELGTLATRLNQMARNLDQNIKALKSANWQLQQDIEKEKSLEKMRKDFIASVSHEFKTPLGIIKAYSEALEMLPNNEKRTTYTRIIMNEIEKMDELVMDLLELSRLESGTYQLNPETFSLSELIDQVTLRFKHQLLELGVKLLVDVEACLVYADYRMMERVLTNFMSNGVRHVNAGGQISVTAKINEGIIKVAIQNTGSSIEETEQGLVWDKFYRVDAAREKSTGGTGLGLSIVKQILEGHGFSYGINSGDNEVTFYFEIAERH